MIIRRIIEDSCGWNKKIWADAVEFALNFCTKYDNKTKVLEIGASEYSALSPIFSSIGYDVMCSYYDQNAYQAIINGCLPTVINKYGLTLPKLVQLNAWEIKNKTFDIIILKSVIGGICRNDDYTLISNLIAKLYASLKPNGILITIDNQENYIANCFRNLFGAGNSKWTYLNKDKLAMKLTPYHYEQKGFGLLNFARFASFNSEVEPINDLLYTIDQVLLNNIDIKNNAVLSTIIFKKE